jgi:hypothetical protein
MDWVAIPRDRRSRRYRCPNRACEYRVSIDAPTLEADVRDELFQIIGSRLRERTTAPDTSALEDELAVAERRLEQVLADEVADDLGELWAPEVRRRREARDAAAAALGEARARSGDEEKLRDLSKEWDGLDPAARREALAAYAVERIEVYGKDEWMVTLR